MQVDGFDGDSRGLKPPAGVSFESKLPVQLLDLGTDAFNCILDHLDHRKSWLRSLMLVSRQMYDLVVPRMYRKLDLWIHDYHSRPAYYYRILHMLDQDNQGLKHIRHLVMRDWDADSISAESVDFPDAALLMQLLPKDTLRSFDWLSWRSLPATIYRTLLSRQRHLEELELIYSDIPIDELTGFSPSSPYLLRELKCIRRLRIMPGPREGIPHVVGQILKDHDTIRQLEINLVHMARSEGPTKDNDVHALCQVLEPPITSLQTLELTGVNLMSSHKLVSTLHLPVLTWLTVAACSHTADFLAALARSAERQPFSLKYLTIHHAQTWDEDNPTAEPSDSTREPLLISIDTLLANLQSCLQQMWICLRGFDTMPLVRGVARHGHTLRWLFFDIRPEKRAVGSCTYILDDWQILCESLTNMQQLDVVLPEPDACRCNPDGNIFDKYIKATASMRKLTTLGINNWPRRFLRLRHGRNGLDNQDATNLLAGVATRIADVRHKQYLLSSTDDTPVHGKHPTEIPSPVLRLISFGIYEQYKYQADKGYDLKPLSFVKSRVHMMGGEVKWKMEPLTEDCLDWSVSTERKVYDVDSFTHDVGRYEHGFPWLQW
ncbi:MAG: hypothetical protein Q9176_006327 [Flavoplaca citrina]